MEPGTMHLATLDISASNELMRLAPDAQSRLEIARAQALKVFGKEAAAAAWLGRVNPAVAGGTCTVASACETIEGFLETIAELSRIGGIVTQLSLLIASHRLNSQNDQPDS
jgi:hypothetical protein